MSTSISLDEKDEMVLRSLASCVRILSVRQVARLRRTSQASARRRMRRLAEGGLVEKITLLAQPLEELRGPLARWKPGQAIPDAASISQAAVSRYARCALETMPAFTATVRTLRHYGLEERPALNRFQQTHDLGMSEVYLYFLRRWRRLTRQCWIGEDVLRHERNCGDKLEDAQLRDPSTGKTVLVVEFAGKYKPARVAAFMDEMRRYELPFMCF